MSSNKQVTIVQQYLTHYRLPFFRNLYGICAEENISLRVYYGREGDRHIQSDVPEWCVPTNVTHFSGITWQHVWKLTASADLVIVEQAVKHLVNYAFLARRLMTRQKLAFMGHGRNFQSKTPDSCAERAKRLISQHADWWFAYNDLSADVVRDLGFPNDRITSFQNAIDTRTLQAARSALDTGGLTTLKSSLGITSDNVAIYTGGLYREKRIEFLLDACSLIRKSVPDFHLIVIGRGPDEELVREASARSEWVHYVGSKNDTDKIHYWALSKVSLMPGLVGLAILDSFALGVPMVTTAYPYHSPEIGYLKNGINAVMIEDWLSPDAYAHAVVDLLRDEARRQQLIVAGRADASIYTVENMAQRFAQGIRAALRAN